MAITGITEVTESSIPLATMSTLRQHCYHKETEQCGLIVLRGESADIVFVPNASDTPKDRFKFGPGGEAMFDRLTDMGESVIVWHSHVFLEAEPGGWDPDDWSPKDIQNAIQSDVPWLLIHAPTGRTRFFSPNQAPAPYEGRSWNLFTSNCETLLRDFYKQEFGIHLWDQWVPSSPRPWEKPGWNEYREYLDRAGFRFLGAPTSLFEFKDGDIALMMVGRAVAPNHAAVVIDGGESILHQLYNKESTKEPYSQDWRDLTFAIYRHPKCHESDA